MYSSWMTTRNSALFCFSGSARVAIRPLTRKVDVRLLAATNRHLESEINSGRFREDLFYRINVMSLELPPLRERGDDIPLLVDHFLGDDWHLEDDALQCLQNFAWPGNVRQLINVLERAKILADDDVIRIKDLPKQILVGPSPSGSEVSPPEASDDLGRCRLSSCDSRS